MNIKQKSLIQFGLAMIFLIVFVSFIHFLQPDMDFFTLVIFIFGGLFWVIFLKLTIFGKIEYQLMRLRSLLYARKMFLKWKEDERKNKKTKRTTRK